MAENKKDTVKKDKYVVVNYFEDLQDNRKAYKEGTRFPKPANKKVSKERIKELSTTDNRQGKVLIKKIEE